MVWFLLWVYKSVPMCCKSGLWNKILIHKSALWRVAILQLTNRYVILPSKETNDMWHVTCDMWLVTHDMWHVVGGEHSLKSSALTVCDLWHFKDLEEKADWLICLLNQLQRCFRTAAATSVLWITSLHCIALHCTNLCYNALHYTTLHYTTLHYTALHCTTLHCIIGSIKCPLPALDCMHSTTQHSLHQNSLFTMLALNCKKLQ